VKYKTFLLFGAPGSGKGTQGHILGTIPGYFHCACGEVFRSLDLTSQLGKIFLSYSSKGQLVPDDVTVQLWQKQIKSLETLGRFNPQTDALVLDGIPRNEHQAKMMDEYLEVVKVFHLSCKDRSKLVERLKRRALHDNRLDDANEDVIRRRLELYDKESKPVLEHYGENKLVFIDANQSPLDVLRSVLANL
jgi:adenylate kinase